MKCLVFLLCAVAASAVTFQEVSRDEWEPFKTRETKRTIAERVKEHIAAVKNQEVNKSAIAEHLINSGVNHWIELHNPKVLSTVRHYYSSRIRNRIKKEITMVKARKYVVNKHFQGAPKREDFDLVEFELPALKDGEILTKTEWISVDPYLRAYNPLNPVPYDQFSYQVGVVQESKNPNYPVGSRVVSHKGWVDYCIFNDSAPVNPSDKIWKVPDLHGLSPSLAIGAVGMTGATAYFGFLEICQPKPGETVVVTGAAGAVGSLVGQIAKIKGCKVIGIAGSDDKVAWLEKELGFDKALNYKTVDLPTALKEAAPKGIDCYFDNVGGEISSTIMYQMNDFGRVAVCGSISSYNDDIKKLPKSTILQPALVAKQLKVEGFIVQRWSDRWPEAFANIIQWIKSGQLKIREHVTEGFDKLYDALIGMLAGENIGKAVVKV